MCCPWIELKEDLTAVVEGAGEMTSNIDVDSVSVCVRVLICSCCVCVCVYVCVCVILDSQRSLHWYTIETLHVLVRTLHTRTHCTHRLLSAALGGVPVCGH